MNTVSIYSFLEQYRIAFLTLHILSMAIGLGGATVSDLLFFKFLKDYRVSKKEEEVLHLLKDVILATICVITLSGIALYLPDADRLNASPMFMVKVIATVVLIANGIALHACIAPHVIHLNLRHHKHMGRGWHRLAFALGGISIVSWYSIFLIAMLKSELSWGFSTMLTGYFSLLTIAIIGSQVVEHMLTAKAKR